MKASALAELLGAELIGVDSEITHISPLDNITEGGIVPLLDKKIDRDVFASDASVFFG